jgi:hypothetical protein
MDHRFLRLEKDGQTYYFSYHRGQETQLYLALMECAADPAHSLSWDETLGIIDEVSRLTAGDSRTMCLAGRRPRLFGL